MRLRPLALALTTATLAAACVKGGPVKPEPLHFVPSTATLYGVADVASLARNPLLKDELLAGYRDRLLRFVGLTAAQAEGVTGLAELFANPIGGAAARVPGLVVAGAPAGERAGFKLVQLGESALVGAPLGTESIVGDRMTVEAALDVRARKAPPLRGSALQTMVAEAAEYRTLRVASINAKALFGLIPGVVLPTSLWSRLDKAALLLTLDDTMLHARVSVVATDAAAAQELGTFAEKQRAGLRAMLAKLRETVGIFGSALDPAIAAIDAIRVETRGQAVWASTRQDLKPIFSSGLITVLRMLKGIGG